MSRKGALTGRRRDGRAAAVDRYVGGQIRLRRKLLGMSQDCLAAALGVSFQQVQKYERGVSCVSAGRLQLIARALEAPVASFFPPPEEDGAAMDALVRISNGLVARLPSVSGRPRSFFTADWRRTAPGITR